MNFKEKVEQNSGCAVILAGSGSDEKHIDSICENLRKFNIPHEVRIASAHKQGEKLNDLVNHYDTWRGSLVYITVASGTDALSGTTSFNSFRPTISCPPDFPNESCTKNPTSSSNAYIPNPYNAARFIAQIFAEVNLDYKLKIQKEISDKLQKLEKEDEKLKQKYEGLQNTK